MIGGMMRREYEQQGEAKENGPGPQELSRRRASLIAEFLAYIHTTSIELALASSEETEALRTPLLQMQLTEEDISAWEKFRALLPRLLHAAHTLHARIGHLLQQAADDRLLDSHTIAELHAFFQSTSIGFREKERKGEELTRKLPIQKMQNADEHPPGEQQRKELERSTLKREQDHKPTIQETRKEGKNEEAIPQESTGQHEEERAHEEPLLLHSTQLHTRWLLTLLPSPIAPLYTAAAARGSAALHAVQKTLEQSLIRQTFGIRHRKGTVILTSEKLQNTEGAIATCQASAAQGEEAKTVILEPLPLPTQSTVVHGIHQTLLHNLRALEQHGMRV